MRVGLDRGGPSCDSADGWFHRSTASRPLASGRMTPRAKSSVAATIVPPRETPGSSSVDGRLQEDVQPIVRFAYLTGWRITSEVLPLQWRHIDFVGNEIRLDAGTTKNDDGRVFPMTRELRALLEDQQRSDVCAALARGVSAGGM